MGRRRTCGLFCLPNGGLRTLLLGGKSETGVHQETRALKGNLTADVVVIGGGFTGCAAAYASVARGPGRGAG